jgi:hypothetical protein
MRNSPLLYYGIILFDEQQFFFQEQYEFLHGVIGSYLDRYEVTYANF